MQKVLFLRYEVSRHFESESCHVVWDVLSGHVQMSVCLSNVGRNNILSLMNNSPCLCSLYVSWAIEMKICFGPLALPRSIKLSFIYNPITLFELFLVIKIVIFNMKVRGESWLQITSPFVFLSTEILRRRLETDQNLCTQKSIALLEMTIQSWTKLIIKFWHHHSQYKFAILSTPPPHTPGLSRSYLKMITKEVASKPVCTWMWIIGSSVSVFQTIGRAFLKMLGSREQTKYRTRTSI